MQQGLSCASLFLLGGRLKKQLHPGLFEENRRSQFGSGFDPGAGSEQIELASLQGVAEAKRIEKRFESWRSELTMKVDEALRSIKLASEAQTNKVQSLEARFENALLEVRTKLQSLGTKVTDSHMADMKTQALMDRHTQLLRQFETRVGQLQKVIEEQEFQILNYQASLEESRRELSKLKRL